MTSKRKLLTTVSVIAAMTALSGCAGSEYLEQRDTITLGVGDSVARNRAIHTINPRPPRAYRTHIHTDGHRMNNAIEQYRSAESSDDGDGNADTRNNSANQDPSGASPQ